MTYRQPQTVDLDAFGRKQAIINAAFNGAVNGFLGCRGTEAGTPIPLTLDYLMVTMISFLMFRKKTKAPGVHGAG
jgi:hypothetical protein